MKISGADRIGTKTEQYLDVDPFAMALLESNIQRVVWGSDWPHINYFDPTLLPNDGDLVNLLGRWLPAQADLEQVLVKNPKLLYGF